MKTMISPHFDERKLNQNNINDLIDVFEDRIKYWLLEPASQLLKDPNHSVAAVALLLSYFEGLFIFISGQDSNGKSKKFFSDGFSEVFMKSGIESKVLTKVASCLYYQARCGFFHDACFRSKILFTFNLKQAFSVTFPKKNGVLDLEGNIESIVINPQRMHTAIDRHLKDYIQILRDPSSDGHRQSFFQACKIKWEFNNSIIIGLENADLNTF